MKLRPIQRLIAGARGIALTNRRLQALSRLLPSKERKAIEAVWEIRASGRFDSAWYLARYPKVALKRRDPVVDYVYRGSQKERNPTPWFDDEFYLRTYPDVAISGQNPFAHYVRIGSGEGRKASQNVRLSFQQALTLLGAAIANDPGGGPGPVLPPECTWFAERVHARGAVVDVMIVDHSVGGGTNAYRQRLVRDAVAEGRLVAILTFKVSTRTYTLTLVADEGSFETMFNDGIEILSIVRCVRVKELFVNSIVSYTGPLDMIEVLLLIKKMSDCRLTIPFHDYFAVCPSYTLLNTRHEFCGVPAMDVCLTCIRQVRVVLPEQLRTRDLVLWRATWKRALHEADRILLFSNASFDLAKRAYPSLDADKCVIKPHVVDYLPHRDYPLDFEQPPVIAVVGQIFRQKGARVVCDVAREIEVKGSGARVVVIGTIADRYAGNVHCAGRYQVGDLPRLLRQTRANLCFVPSIWPETFCYVAEELMALKMPLAVFDLGAQAERVRDYPQGLVIGSRDPAIVLRELVNFHRRLHAEGYQ